MQHYYPLGSGSIFETTMLSFSITLVMTKEWLCCLLAAPLYVFWGRIHPFSVLLGCTAGQKPRQLKWKCPLVVQLWEQGLLGWWLHSAQQGVHPAAHSIPVHLHPCLSPAPQQKLLMSSGSPHGQPGADMHDLVLNYHPVAASICMGSRVRRQRPCLHSRSGSMRRANHPTTDEVMLSKPAPPKCCFLPLHSHGKGIFKVFELLPLFPPLHMLACTRLKVANLCSEHPL